MQRATIYKTFLILALILTAGTYNKCSAAASSDRRITKKEIYASIDRFNQKTAKVTLEKCTQWQGAYREQISQGGYSSIFLDQTKQLLCQLAQQEDPYFFAAIRRLPRQRITLTNGSQLTIPPEHIITLDCLTMCIQQMQSPLIVDFLPRIDDYVQKVIQRKNESSYASSSK